MCTIVHTINLHLRIISQKKNILIEINFYFRPDVGLEHMIDINSVMILDVLNYDNWNTINDRATTIDLGSDKKFLHNIK